MWRNDLITWLYLSAIPLCLLVVITVAGRYLRRSIAKSMTSSAAPSSGTSSAEVYQGQAELQTRIVNASTVSTPPPNARDGIQEVKACRSALNTAFVVAAIVFTTLATGAVLGDMISQHIYPKDSL